VLAIFGDKDTIVNFKQSARVYAQALRKAGNQDVLSKYFQMQTMLYSPAKQVVEKN
jgi:hypothetical protein